MSEMEEIIEKTQPARNAVRTRSESAAKPQHKEQDNE